MAGSELTRVRLYRGLSQTELAARAGLARSTICKLESGAAMGALETWLAIGEALLVDYRRILPPPSYGLAARHYPRRGVK